MVGILVDSTIFIEYLRSRTRANTALANLPADSILYTSSVTVFELFSGATDADKRHAVQTLLQDLLILPINFESAIHAGEIYRSLRSRGLMIEIPDILIAATAITNKLPHKTLNTRHFERVEGLQLL